MRLRTRTGGDRPVLRSAHDAVRDRRERAFGEFASPAVAGTPLMAAGLGPDAALYGTVRAAMLGDAAFV
ncbi:hypothetical protein [Spirillospora sp. NPDC029432]|uniref:hypothetical protein n=1 Tax=Spirillospora sp. NPDC029432 TaxID=3154599 RepID=UPI0034541502